MSGPTGVLLMNMGGPRSLREVPSFLEQVLTDKELIELPFQDVLGPLLARTQTRSWRKKYEAIGGYSPLLNWTERQAAGLADRLDRERPETAPHLVVPCFRYSHPDAVDALRFLREAGVRDVIAFTQYPHYSCTTTGASLHDLWKTLERPEFSGRFDISVIDRFGSVGSYVAALAATVECGLAGFPEDVRDSVVIVYSAHTLPRKVIENNDPYLQEVTATVGLLVAALGTDNPYVLAFQEAGRRDQGPDTGSVVRGLAAQGYERVLVVPVAFTTDHEETLWETDVELAEEAHEAGIVDFRRTPALNDRDDYVRALADIVGGHLDGGRAPSRQLPIRCLACTDPACRLVPDLDRPVIAPSAGRVVLSSGASHP